MESKTNQSGLRQRKKHHQKQKHAEPSVNNQSGNALRSPDDSVQPIKNVIFWIWLSIGCILLVVCGWWFAKYMEMLHENQMWFTNIQEVEREISLRTECGLYYSYYKQLIQAPTFSQGLRDLTMDNATEQDRTINILQRFNIYQEVVLAFVYRFFVNKETLPILFYVYSIFKLNGFYVSVLFALTWLLCGGGQFWLPGLLTVVFFTVNLEDSTRVFFTINLRESFGFPFLWLQIFFICLFLRRSKYSGALKDIVLSLTILATSYLFAITWQFNQFILLVQSCSLYVVALLHLAPEWKVRRVMVLQVLALLLACATQFGQRMLLGSLLLTFVPGAIVSLYLCRGWTISGGIVTGALKLIIQTCFTLILTFTLHFVLKSMLRIEADDHIFKFLKGKFGFSDPRDFDSRIYLCHGAFAFLSNDFFFRTSFTFVFPLYMCMLCGSLFIIGKDVLSEWCALVSPREKYVPYDSLDVTDKVFYFNRRPELAYLVIQSTVSGLLAMMALRMKYLWSPHIYVLACVLLGDVEPWRSLFAKVKVISKSAARLYAIVISSALCLFLITVLSYDYYLTTYRRQMDDLKEFYDPDTVELMYWIGNNTAPHASFGGSMQLLAGVKLCTGRHLTNHPHFEDKFLRERTKQVYQIYGRRKPEDVHRILRSFHTDYIILEDSICLARSDSCRSPDLVDLDNWHIPDNGYSLVDGLRKTDVPRFCDQIRFNGSQYTKYFRLVLENKTFRVYQLL